jgi:Fic family protein
LGLDGTLSELHAKALASLDLLAVAGAHVPGTGWFLYGFVRKEAVISSQIEGTQATLREVVTFEATKAADRPHDVEEVCNYINAVHYARAEIAGDNGLPISTRLLCEAHRLLTEGVRGEDKLPGQIRRSQNWIGGTRPGNATFVGPPPDDVGRMLADLENWIHEDDPLPPLVRTGCAHVQFETIHPFLDGNGRIGRLLITLLLEHWGLLESPLLYLSLPLKRHQLEYYQRLTAVRTEGDWEGWTGFFLTCVDEAAQDGVRTAKQMGAIIGADRARLTAHPRATVPTIRLLDLLPEHPVQTLPLATGLLDVSKPTAIKAIGVLEDLGILRETTGKQRDRIYAYERYLQAMTAESP